MQLTASLMHTLLVACDQSYKTTANGVVAGDVLTFYPDSNGGNPGTDHMPSDWFADLDGWTVDKRIDDAATGFGATVYRKPVAGQPGKFDYIVALQGTRGPSMQDWNDNITYGWKKFNSEYGGRKLIDYLTGAGVNGILDKTNQINFTGQSLGGALAQYTAYRYVDKLANVDLSKVSLTTFNGLGGVQGLMDNYQNDFGPAAFNPGLLAGVVTAHYYVENDFVSRLGTGNLNGAGNEYCLNFQTQKDGTLVQYDPVDAHRIESGFYRGFNLGLTNPSLGPSDFTFVAKNIAHLEKVTGVAGVAGTITTLFDDNYSGGQESFTRLLAGLIVGSSFGDAEARKEVVLGVLDHLKAAGKIGDGWYAWAANVGDKALANFATNPGGLATTSLAFFMSAVANAASSDAAQGVGAAYQQAAQLLQNMNIPFAQAEAATYEKLGELLQAQGQESRQDKKFSDLSASNLVLSLPVILGGIPALAEAHAQDLFEAIKGRASWVGYVGTLIGQWAGSDAKEYAYAQVRYAEIITQQNATWISAAKQDVLREAWATKSNQEIADLVTELSKTLANAVTDFTAKITDGVTTTLTEFSDWASESETINGFLSKLRTVAEAAVTVLTTSSNAEGAEALKKTFDDAEEIVTNAAQTIVLTPDKGNPFAGAVDPNDTDSDDLAEGHLQGLTLYLPYAAGEGGQKVRLTLVGASADAFTLLDQGQRIDIGADGIFTVTVREGQTSLAFGLWQNGDVDVDGTLTLKAQLVDAEGNPTHTEHTEVTLNLDATDEATPSPIDRTIVGDFAAIDFSPEPGIQYHYDELGNVIVDPGQPEPGRGDVLKGSAGNDSIDGRAGSDDLRAGAGNDQVKGGTGNDGIEGGSGNDTLQGGADADVMLGDADDDEVFADTQQTRTQALAANDASVGSSAVRGDWADGGAGADLVVGGADADVLLGGDGQDLLLGGAGNDNLSGDSTTNIVFLDWTLTRQVQEDGDITRYKSLFNRAVLDTPAGGNDILLGGSGDDWLLGESGDDVIDGGKDNDVAFGGQGDDQLLGATGNDVLSGDELDDPADPENSLSGTLHGHDYLDGGEGHDKLTGNGGDDILLGGTGDDSLAGDDVKTPGHYHGKDYLEGGDGNDRLWGDGGDDELLGGDGADHLEGDYSTLDTQTHGQDILSGGAGNDELIGGGKNDALQGGDGNDILAGDDTADAPLAAEAHGADTLDGGAGNDSLIGGGKDDQLQGADGDDLLEGDGETVAEGGNDLLDGGIGKDVLHGNGGHDTLLGGADDDSLLGQAGDDTLIGGAGTDALEGGEGDDTYEFAAGDSPTDANGLNEGIVDLAGTNTVVFQSATVDDLTLYSANDGAYLVIDYGPGDRLLVQGGFGGAVSTYQFANGERLSYAELIGRLTSGVNTVTGAGGQPIITGGHDANTLDAPAGGAILSGGQGNDTLTANGGGNTYLYSVGDGTDTITDTSKQNGFTAANTLRFGHGIAASDIKLGLGSLLIRVGHDAADAIHIEGFDPSDVYAQRPIDRFEFADGTVLTYEELLARGFDLEGTAGHDTISGTNIADRLTGGAGNDTLIGGEGSDTYAWGIGAGQDVIDNTDSAPVKTDVLQIGPGLRPEDLAFVRGVNDLIVRVRNATDQVTVTNHFAGAAIGSVAFSDGTVWGAAEIDAHLTNELTAGADIYAGTVGDDVIDGLGGNDTLQGFAGNDLLVGGVGADSLVGGVGADMLDGRGDDAADALQGGTDGDVYLFGHGSGADVITEAGDATSTDVLRLDAGILPSAIRVVRSGVDALFQIVGFTDQMRIVGAYAANAGPSSRIERIEFADGTVWDEAAIRQQILLAEPTGSGDVIEGFDGNDRIDGLAGNDALYGNAGNDSLLGGVGYDTLVGGTGDDVLEGGVGDAGNCNYTDKLYGEAGNDTYLFGRGSGYETIFETQVDVGGNVDTIVFGPGVGPEDILLSLDNQTNLQMRIQGTNDYLLVSNFLATQDSQWKVERFVFENGMVWTSEMVMAKLTAGTPGPDTLNGLVWGDTIDGAGGNDLIYGNAGNDVLEGGEGNDALYGDDYWSDLTGNDTLHGGAGNDTLTGGKGDDAYLFLRGDEADRIIESSGNDRVFFGADILPEHLALFRNGNHLVVAADGSTRTSLTIEGFFTAVGQQVEEFVFAGGVTWDIAQIQANTIAGTPNAMTGTTANDTFVVDDFRDTISESVGQGIDTVLTSVNYALPANVENITATGYLDVWLSGNTLGNMIIGNVGNNSLSGGDGGVDTLKGGLGDDSYNILSSASVVELPGQGIDTITVSSSQWAYLGYTLPDNVENLVMQNANGIASGTGNALDNTISIENNVYGRYVGYGEVTGNSINGGAGADRMSSTYGGTFYVDNVGDTVSGNGLLNVISSVDYALPDVAGLGNNLLSSILTLSGSAAINAKGNSYVNVLDGRQNPAVNMLEGGSGDDTYYAGTNDIIVEDENGGIDTFMAYANSDYDVFYLPENVENIEMWGADRNAKLYGNDVANRLQGNAGSNSIFGYGGNDTISGGTNSGDTLDGGDGNDIINGSGYLLGGTGSDKLTSLYGSVLTGGMGNDTLTGQAQTDIYVFARGDGQDVILDYSRIADYNGNPMTSNDTIEFAGDLSPHEILLSCSGDDLLVAVSGSSDQITVEKHFAADTATNSFRMDRIRFADGTEWTASAIENRIARNNANTATELSDVSAGSSGADTILALGGDDLVSGGAGDDALEGGDGNDVLYGNSGDDTLAGSAGDDTLYGGIGSDTYRFGRGAGVDTVIDPLNGAEIDTVLIDADVSPSQVQITKGGQYNLDLILSIVDDPAQLVLKNFAMIDASSGRAKRVQFADGTVWDSAALVERTDSLFGSGANDSLAGTANADKIFGLAGNDSLQGLGGDDLLDGGLGADVIAGGSGNDIFVVDDAGDVVVEADGDGTDTVRASISYTLAANVERLELLGNIAIDGAGNALNNVLVGNSADNLLSGGLGADTLIGGAGNDSYVVDATGDVVTENANDGTDAVTSSVTYTLSANVENLTLAGTAAINGTGNSLNNVLVGNSAANVLTGGAGNDTYYVSTGDTVTESSNAGTDTVVADVTWTLGSNLENLTLTGTAAINGTGNTLANTLIGNSATNTLSGGTGADTMKGGAGNDTYTVDNAGDVVTELANEGTDLINSSVTYTLAANVENLTLTGTSAINGTGNALANVLTGNSANNTLTGGDGNDTLNGGSGNDTMVGGAGDDTYVVNVSTDVVTEAANAGIDTVQSSVTLTLAANAEALVLTGASAINGTGNTLNNLLRGNTAANTLNGGTGNDVLEGGAGNDTLTDTSGTALFNGGAGTDKLTGGAGAELYLGGLGNDILTTAAGNDVMLFNKGDGQDTFAAGGTGSDTLSLGGAFAYSDLTFSKSSSDLVLKLGASDQITFKNWYAATPSKPVVNLQVIAEAMAGFEAGGSNPLLDQKVENFNFGGLAGAFDAARTANPILTSWALTNALLDFHLAGSDSAAIGGDLAYQYGKNGTLAGIGFTAAQEVIGNANLGSQAQTLRPLESLQTGSVRLS